MFVDSRISHSGTNGPQGTPCVAAFELADTEAGNIAGVRAVQCSCAT